MARRKEKQLVRPAARDIYANSVAATEVKKKDNSKLLNPPKSDGLHIGIPVPLVFQFLLGSGVLQLGGVAEVNAPPMTFKTALMYEFGRWFMQSGGWLEMVLTEGKYSPTYAHSVIGWHNDARAAINVWDAEYMDDMQSICMERYMFAKKLAEDGLDGHPPAGWTFPVLIGVDSIMGSTMKEKGDKIKKEGYASRQYAIEAGSLTDFAKELKSQVRNSPVLFLMINHRKESPGDTPYETKATKPGGKQIQFQATYIFDLSRGKSVKPKINPDVDGSSLITTKMLRIKVSKNSAGKDGNEIVVPITMRDYIYCGENGDEPAQVLQKTVFHWDEALIDVLMDFGAGKRNNVITSGMSRLEKMDHFLHLRSVSRGNQGIFYYSKTLGMDKHDAMPKGTLGKLISRDKDAVEALRLFWGIPKSETWDTSVDFRHFKRERMLAAADVASVRLADELSQLAELEEFANDEEDDSKEETTTEGVKDGK